MKKSLMTACAMALSLTACSHEPIKLLCPQTAIIHDLERITDYGLEDRHEPQDMVATATMKKVDGACTFNKGDDDKANDPERGLSVDFTLKLTALKGPRLGSNRFGFPYFVTIIDPTDKVIAKNLLTVDFTFPSDTKTVDQDEPLHIFIPTQNVESVKDYRVLMGFQLTEKQLKESRGEAKHK